MSRTHRLSTEEKALRINLDTSIYGSFNEIGAGQEVASNFFRAGGSSGTIASSRSAYDMKVSDTIYGECKRYVCEDRLNTMLDYEYKLLIDLLPEKVEEKRFFAFCNTVEALNYHKTNQGQGWLGLRFQVTPQSEPNEIVLHVKMHDSKNAWQQEAIGILGVNLMHSSYFLLENSLDEFLQSLCDRLSRERIEIDMLRVSGPDFAHIDNRLIALKLVKMGFTDATMFNPSGKVLQPSGELYKKNVLLMRGRFRPATKVNFDMLECGLRQFNEEHDVDPNNVITLFELTLKDLKADGDIDEQDFLDRAQLLCMLGQTVMISNYVKYYKVVEYLSQMTKRKKIGVLLGVYSLETIFDKSYYRNLPGGILQAFGMGFGGNAKLYVYPAIKINSKENELLTCDNADIPEKLQGLYKHMRDNNRLEGIEGANQGLLHIYSDKVIAMIHAKENGWEDMVPDPVVEAIKEHNLFGYVERVTA